MHLSRSLKEMKENGLQISDIQEFLTGRDQGPEVGIGSKNSTKTNVPEV